MPQFDGTREEIAYLKLWLGVMLAAGVSLFAWLLNNFRSANGMLVAGGFALIVLFGFGCLALHRRITSKIEEVRRL